MLTFNDSLTQIIFIALILYLQVVHVMLSLLFCKEQLHWFGPIIIVKLINVSQTFSVLFVFPSIASNKYYSQKHIAFCKEMEVESFHSADFKYIFKQNFSLLQTCDMK